MLAQIYIDNPSHPFLLKARARARTHPRPPARAPTRPQAGAFDEAYKMVQPAMVVLDSARKVSEPSASIVNPQ